MKTSITALAMVFLSVAAKALAHGPGGEYGVGPGMMWGYGA